MAPSPLDKQTASCSSPHDWIMSLVMDLTALCDMCGGENDTNGHQFAVFSVRIASLPATLWLPACPPPSHPIGVLVVCIDHTSKNYLKWQAVQLAIYLIVGK